MSGPVHIDATNAAEKAKAVAAGVLPGPAKTLAEALARIYADGGRYVQKTGTMQGPARYSYAKEGDFIAVLRPLMEAHGVTVRPVAMQVLANEAFERKNGGTAYRVVVLATYELLHASGDKAAVQAIGEGQDSGDKAFNKAMTGAMKYALRQTFCVETGDDPDDTPSHEQERAARPQPAPAHPPGAAPAKPANAAAVARFTQAFAQCGSKAEFDKVAADVAAAGLAETDRLAVRRAAADTLARLGA
jgi:hypothetical protein